MAGGKVFDVCKDGAGTILFATRRANVGGDPC